MYLRRVPQLPPALARRIEALGHSAEHVVDCGLATAADDAIRNYAASIGAVIITKDEDFVIREVLQKGPSVVWIRIGNTRRAELLRRSTARSGDRIQLEQVLLNLMMNSKDAVTAGDLPRPRTAHPITAEQRR